ncbi:hypothetical protein B0J18DRAFT_166276 [Chaetomium sp. MPI-SDFR-AT-0129]|nr:hypothetical protein B0J18DRAFT_166276 [Chaetomium sp. MPI-SDFR-AT-0129]
MHAREWVSTMVTEYIAYSLLEGYDTGRDIEHALESFDFYIFPIVNPDGFVFTQTKDRLWRKNRQINAGKGRGASCVGRDLNRNWASAWGKSGGASDKPCRSTFRGFRPLDAPETRALAVELEAIREEQGIRLFIDWHAFGQLVMHPRGHTCAPSQQPSPHSPTRWVASELASAMRAVHGADYRAGAACELLYPTSGDSADYAFDVLGVEYAYTVELRPGIGKGKGGRGGKRRSGGSAAGFALPEREIRMAAEEAWGGVRHVLRLIHAY